MQIKSVTLPPIETTSINLLPHSFYERPTVMVAHDLIGNLLVRNWNGIILSSIIAETEAYGATDDPASHAYKKETLRNKAMFGPVGHSYVYFTYGNHHCLNIVARESSVPAGGVLIRSIIPVQGVEMMYQLRKMKHLKKLTDGPGKIGQALQLSLKNNHIDVTKQGELYVVQSTCAGTILATPRIGIKKAQDKLWRFVLQVKNLPTINVI